MRPIMVLAVLLTALPVRAANERSLRTLGLGARPAAPSRPYRGTPALQRNPYAPARPLNFRTRQQFERRWLLTWRQRRAQSLAAHLAGN